MQPDEAEFRDWLQHPVTEWIFRLCNKQAGDIKGKWADIAWTAGEIDPTAFTEARVRADCYAELACAAYADWKAIDDSEA